MANLITLPRALSQIPNAPAGSNQLVTSLITAASGVIETYCRRKFAKATHRELQPGKGSQYLYVKNPPILSINAVRTGRLPAFYLQYNDPQNQTQAAQVTVTDTAVVLTRTYNNVTTPNTFSFEAYPRITDLVTGINALNTNWVATHNTQFDLWQSSELNILQGSFSARNISVGLQVFWYGLGNFRFTPDIGEIFNPGGWCPGYENYLIEYVGGYEAIPEEIQQACAELVQLTFATLTANPLMQSETLDKYSYTRSAEVGFAKLSVTSKMALNQYRIITVPLYK